MPGLRTVSKPSLIVEIIEAVADREGVDVTELPPLGEVVDPDALNSLFEFSEGWLPGSSVAVRFRYCGYTVVVDEDREIWLD